MFYYNSYRYIRDSYIWHFWGYNLKKRKLRTNHLFQTHLHHVKWIRNWGT